MISCSIVLTFLERLSWILNGSVWPMEAPPKTSNPPKSEATLDSSPRETILLNPKFKVKYYQDFYLAMTGPTSSDDSRVFLLFSEVEL